MTYIDTGVNPGVIQQAREALRVRADDFGKRLALAALRAVVEAADAGYLIDTRTRRDGDAIVIGPECFASADELVICWKGVNYYAPMDGNDGKSTNVVFYAVHEYSETGEPRVSKIPASDQAFVEMALEALEALDEIENPRA